MIQFAFVIVVKHLKFEFIFISTSQKNNDNMRSYEQATILYHCISNERGARVMYG